MIYLAKSINGEIRRRKEGKEESKILSNDDNTII